MFLSPKSILTPIVLGCPETIEWSPVSEPFDLLAAKNPDDDFSVVVALGDHGVG